MATRPIADHCANLLKGTTSPRLSEVHRNLRGQYAIYLHSCPDGTRLGNSTKPPPGTHSSHPPGHDRGSGAACVRHTPKTSTAIQTTASTRSGATQLLLNRNCEALHWYFPQDNVSSAADYPH